MREGNHPTFNGEASDLALIAAERKGLSAKSDESMAFYNTYMPPLKVIMQDGSVHSVKYSELDERLEELRQERKARRKSHDKEDNVQG